ncbi:alpha/beta fold hydrolase [Amorphus sp. 3PC139-8]|uniref:alpha/beta fold hydrolase n=1 Tax=Amorphus sp. 3PC139-8 TaxID=2735676 RepID=UPI00345DF4DC
MTDSGILELQGASLAWDTAGHGPGVVLLHGFSCDTRMWDPQTRALAPTYRIVRYDLRGFGASSLPSGPYDHADDLLAMIDSHGLQRPLVVGLSLGANIALAFARRFPDRLSGLLLAAPGLPGHVWTEERPPEAAKAYARTHDVAAVKAFWLGHPLFASLADAPRARDVMTAMVEDYSGWHWTNTDPQAPIPGLPEALPTIATPTLVISGERDAAGYREIARRIAADMPQARLVSLKDVGHMVNLEAEDAFNRLLLQFADETAPATSEATQ